MFRCIKGIIFSKNMGKRMNIEEYEENLKIAIEKLKTFPLHELDTNPKLLKEAFDILYNHEVFSLYKVALSEHNKYKFILFSTLTPYSGSLAFLAIQILAGNTIMLLRDFKQREAYFQKRCGIAINHLRATTTHVSATKFEEGYQLTGKLSWASGYGVFDTLVIGFHHDGKEYEAIAPFKSSDAFQVSDLTESFVGESVATVNIELNDFFVKEDDVISFQPLGTYNKSRSVSKTIHFALYGLGLGALTELKDEALKVQFDAELERVKEAFMNGKEAEEMEQLRVELFFLVQKIVTTAMVLKGGKSILAEETLQRYYRELIMFNANGLNESIKGYFRDFVLG
ncbi:MAG: Unknown protein [uncultured Sulfurovum sp.]|uniref:Acyl-CoA dehydrogenase n=1 Tax=uncultured Sulfurovum sp. TaxID=269237 RepID=A0A6S6THT8_9BACT|nr:MAG: Unknown protein [uncultured Sulfurovum sp.]